MRSLASALKDFGAPKVAAAEPFVSPPGFPGAPGIADGLDFPATPDFALSELPAFPEMEQTETVDVEAAVAEAVAQAEAALADKLAQEHAEALQAERDRHAQEMSELQAQFADEAAAKILASIGEMEARLVELTSAVTARILGGVLTDDLRQRSIGKLAQIIREALADDEALRIRVRGNLPLYEELKERLPEHADQIDFTESTNFDLSVTIDDSVFETRLAEWSSALAEAFA